MAEATKVISFLIWVLFFYHRLNLETRFRSLSSLSAYHLEINFEMLVFILILFALSHLLLMLTGLTDRPALQKVSFSVSYMTLHHCRPENLSFEKRLV